MMFSNKMNCVGLHVFQFEVTRGTGESENEELNFKKKNWRENKNTCTQVHSRETNQTERMKENPWLSADTDNLPAGTMSLLEGMRYNGEQNGSRWTLHRLGPNYSA